MVQVGTTTHYVIYAILTNPKHSNTRSPNISQVKSTLMSVQLCIIIFGNPRHTQSMIAYIILPEDFWKSSKKLHCGMLLTTLP